MFDMSVKSDLILKTKGGGNGICWINKLVRKSYTLSACHKIVDDETKGHKPLGK